MGTRDRTTRLSGPDLQAPMAKEQSELELEQKKIVDGIVSTLFSVFMSKEFDRKNADIQGQIFLFPFPTSNENFKLTFTVFPVNLAEKSQTSPQLIHELKTLSRRNFDQDYKMGSQSYFDLVIALLQYYSTKIDEFYQEQLHQKYFSKLNPGFDLLAPLISTASFIPSTKNLQDPDAQIIDNQLVKIDQNTYEDLRSSIVNFFQKKVAELRAKKESGRHLAAQPFSQDEQITAVIGTVRARAKF